MDLLTAHRLVIGTQESLNKCVRSVDEVKRAADACVEWANAKLQEKEDCEVVVQAVLPEKRVRRKKAMPGELAEDEPVSDAEADYRIKVHTLILDTVTESIQSRYAANGPLCADFAYFDPWNFPKIKEMGLPTEAERMLYDERATAGRLQAELSSLANCWERLKMPHLDAYNVRTTGVEDGREEDLELENSCKYCKNCAICVHHVLSQYNLLTDAYHVIGLGYKFLRTLSFSQLPVRGPSPH
ncbi:hypothetical protein KUCAC02_014189 [Chaenocephalus aceratus]|uniref:Uncharacterized protein n=1 Tax=Chaenocephalus aceratus TaxID=36190 RepID=A0ACB9WDY7_CHAAC|nr:hypothetical protein KUCAC02_014189 [Chaenocephalus aceratus]